MSEPWSQYQEQIFAHIASSTRHLVIQAYAGCGKTTTVVEGTNRVPRGRRVSMTAFNKRIADTLKTRVRNAYVATFHSAGLRTVTRSLGRLDVDKEKVKKLCLEAGVHDFTTRCAIEKVVGLCKNSLTVKGPVTEQERPAVIRAMDELADDFGVDLPPAIEKREVFFEAALQVIEECLDPSKTNTLDFDDMAWLPLARGLRLDVYDVLFVDELQDMNATQLALSLKMLAAGGRMVSCGDSHQAIYSFRGAQNDAVNWLAGILQADTLELPICYRCDRAIIRLAQTLVPGIQAAPSAGEGTVEEASIDRMLRDAQEKDFVLSRSNAPLISTCLRFLAANKPARIQGRDIGRSLASFVRNSRCESVSEFRSYVEAWKQSEVARLQQEKRSPQSVIDRADCLLVLSDGAPRVDDVVRRIESLFDDDRPGIVCSTIHKAKGLEADRVWLLGTSFKGCHYWTRKQMEGLDDESVDYARAFRRVREENNILYVGITRARHELYCVDGVPEPL
jgi:superfamily I DNA/RNA helicase